MITKFEFDETPDVLGRKLDREKWSELRVDIERKAFDLFGRFPERRCALNPEILDEEHCDGYTRRHVRFQSEPEDAVFAYLLIPDALSAQAPAVIAIHTSASAGKDCTVGRTGIRPEAPPDRDLAYALDAVGRGFVALAPDMDTNGERAPDGRVWDTKPFYARCPQWSAMGKAAWDISRAVDYLSTLDFVDKRRIACMGHCFGGYCTVMAAAFEPRISAALTSSGLWAFRGTVRDAFSRDINDPEQIRACRKGWGEKAGVYCHIPRLVRYLDPATGLISDALPVDYYHIAAMIAPRPFCVSIPSGDILWLRKDVDPAAAERQKLLTARICSAIKQAYDAYGVPERFQLWITEGTHTWKAESKQRAFDFWNGSSLKLNGL